MKVYIVCSHVDYEGNDILKVFQHKEKAQQFVDRVQKLNDKERWAEDIPFFDSLIIEEMEVYL